MATGLSSYFDLQCSNTYFQVRINWSETYDASTNSSVVTISSVQLKSTGYYGVNYYPDGTISINGTPVITMSSYYGTHSCRLASLNSWNTIYEANVGAATGKTTVVHNSDGTGSVNIEVQIKFYKTGSSNIPNGWGCSTTRTIALTTIPTYTLSISAGTGSSITVNRTSSGYASTGNITAGTRLYYGDKLKITFSPAANYQLLTTRVNNSNFTSGSTHTVAANVTVSATAQVLASNVGATNADIGSVSTVTVTKYNSGYYHSLQYKFGSLTGYITSSGDVSATESKFNATSVAFKIPDTFYAQIPNSKTGTCTITCRTYSSASSTTILGNATTCNITVTAISKPDIIDGYRDIDPTTVALTGNDRTIVRYRSNMELRIRAIANNSASIVAKYINDVEVGTGDETSIIIHYGESETKYIFKATDSRGYSTTITSSPQIVAYTPLTLNADIKRPTPTGKEVSMSVSGNYYRGSFGAYSNTLNLSYRYRESTETAYTPWYAIPSTSYDIGTSTYSSPTYFLLDADLDYRKSYVFQVKAFDGTEEYPLTTITKEIVIQPGIPVFDWGEKDFAFNVPVKINDGSLTIGDTSISEDQLKKILALIT